MEEKKTETAYREEINLYEFFYIIKKRLKLILGMFIISTVLTAVISFLLPPVYRGSFIIKIPGYILDPGETTIISPGETIWIIEKLDGMRKDKMFKELSEKLDIEEEKIKEMVSVRAKDIRGEKNIVEITVDVRNQKIIDDLKQGIMRYLNQNPYVNERISFYKNELVQFENEIQSKINEIYVLKNAATTQIKQGRLNIVGYNPIEVENSVIDLKQRLVNLQTKINLLKGFNVVVEPIILKKPVKPRKLLNITIAGVSSVILGMFLAYFMTWFERNRKSSE
jgi:capsular polysaccharide biosynthesis protein